MTLKCFRSVLILPMMLACVSSQVTREPAGAKSLNEAAQFLDKLLAGRVLKLDRSVLLFHYEHEDFNLKSQTEVADHVAEFTSHFFDPSKMGGGEAGPGVYAANDPQQSRGYGYKTPKLFVVPLRAGIRVLNLDIVTRETDARLGYELLKKLRCANNIVPAGFNDFFSRMRQSENSTCRNLIIDAVRRTGAAAITYGWRAATKMKSCRAYRPDAVNIISREAIDLANVAYFTDDTQISPDPLLNARIGRLFRDLEADPLNKLIYRTDGETHRPRTLTSRRGRTRDYEAWKAARIAYCGPQWNLESDSLPYAIYLNKIRSVYQDMETRRLQVALKSELAKAYPDIWDSADLFDLRIIEKLMAQRLGIIEGSQAFENFLLAKDHLNAVGPQQFENTKIERAAGILHEPAVRLNNGFVTFYMDQTLDSLRDQQASLEMAPESLRALGFGPVLSDLVAQKYLQYNFLVPLLLAKEDSATETPERAAEKNKQLAHDVIKRCLKYWKDPNQSVESKKSGECGARPRDKSLDNT